MFESARLKLTFWYLLIIMMVSIIFSGVVYSRVNFDLTRFERMQIHFQEDLREGRIREFPGPKSFTTRLNPEEIEETRKKLIGALVVINLAILGFAGTAGYFLAGRTLRPIKEMVDEQNRFISDSSHELRTPLTSLRSEIEVALRNEKLNLTEAERILKSNLEEVISLQGLSDNLLELAQNGRLVNKKLMKEVSAQTVVNEAIKKTNKLAKAKQIKIENKIKDVKVLGIEDRLVEIFVILLDNAIKYSSKKGGIEISSRQTDGKVGISVIDHGIGISENDFPYIFDRFYRSNKSRSEDGYGLGLSIAKKIIDAHNGNIDVVSELNKETRFTVTLSS